jgi:hypothetical protein
MQNNDNTFIGKLHDLKYFYYNLFYKYKTGNVRIT